MCVWVCVYVYMIAALDMIFNVIVLKKGGVHVMGFAYGVCRWDGTPLTNSANFNVFVLAISAGGLARPSHSGGPLQALIWHSKFWYGCVAHSWCVHIGRL